jgi:hypothetical protein
MSNPSAEELHLWLDEAGNITPEMIERVMFDQLEYGLSFVFFKEGQADRIDHCDVFLPKEAETGPPGRRRFISKEEARRRWPVPR